MKIYDCKCQQCQAEFQAAMENSDEKLTCPSCDSEKISVTETDLEFGCGGGCASCGGCAGK